MTVKDLKQLLKGVPDQTPVLVENEFGFVSACMEDSGPGTANTGEDVFVLLPCTCHTDEPIEFDLHADDFPDPEAN